MSKKRQSMRDRMRERLKEEKKSGGSNYINLNGQKIEFFKPKEDTYMIDIVPYPVTMSKHPHKVEEGEDWYTKPYEVHKKVGVDEETVVCLKSFGKKCPICDEAWEIWREDNKNKDLLPKQRNLYLVYVHEQADKGVQLFDASAFGFEDKLKKALEKAEKKGQDEYLEFADPETGYTLEVDFEESVMGKNKWCPAVSIKFEEREPLSDEILNQAIELDEILVSHTASELEKMLFGTTDDGDEESYEEDEDTVEYVEEEEEKPKRQSRRDTKKKDPEPEEEEDDVPMEEEPAKEEPKRRSRRRERTDTSTCPEGHEFGKDFNKKDGCATCPDKEYDACEQASE